MNTNLDFVLGSISSLGIILLGFTIYNILKTNKRLKELEKLPKAINDLGDKSIADFNATHNTIDSLNNNLSKDIDSSHNVLRSYIDSRFDKLTSNIANEIVDIRKENHELRKLIEEVATDHSERISVLETHKKIDDDKIIQINS